MQKHCYRHVWFYAFGTFYTPMELENQNGSSIVEILKKAYLIVVQLTR